MNGQSSIAARLVGRSFAGVDDFSNAEIMYVLACASDVAAHRERYADVCRGKIMASLFFEPSTRTRLSFESAMLRLGGQVISSVDIGSTSLAKGETLADMAKVVGGYADILVMRHPWEGAARVVADYAGIPVINAGDGGHEHPTQTLCDLYTLKMDRGKLEGLRIALWGDLKYGRTVHSLAWALARFGSTIVFRPGAGLDKLLVEIRRNGLFAIVLASPVAYQGPVQFRPHIQSSLGLFQKSIELWRHQALEGEPLQAAHHPHPGFQAPRGHVGALVPMGEGGRRFQLPDLPHVLLQPVYVIQLTPFPSCR